MTLCVTDWFLFLNWDDSENCTKVWIFFPALLTVVVLDVFSFFLGYVDAIAVVPIITVVTSSGKKGFGLFS